MDAFIQSLIEQAVATRAQHWQRDFSSLASYNRSIEANRQRFAHQIGVRDSRVPFTAPTLVATTDQGAQVGRGAATIFTASAGPAFGEVHAEGLLLEPRERKPQAPLGRARLCTDAGANLRSGTRMAPSSQFARRLAESGCRFLIPTLIDRSIEVRGEADFSPYARQPMSSSGVSCSVPLSIGASFNWLRSAKSLGRCRLVPLATRIDRACWIWEGALLAFYAAALDARIEVTGLSGYFDARRNALERTI